MTNRSVLEKMGRRPDDRVLLVGVPTHLVDLLRGQARPFVIDHSGEVPAGSYDAIHICERTRRGLQAALPSLREHLAPRGRLWVIWPKGKPAGVDLGLREVIAIVYAAGLVESTTLAVDHEWSAIKLTHPIPGKEDQNSYGTLPSDIE